MIKVSLTVKSKIDIDFDVVETIKLIYENIEEGIYIWGYKGRSEGRNGFVGGVCLIWEYW